MNKCVWALVIRYAHGVDHIWGFYETFDQAEAAQDHLFSGDHPFKDCGITAVLINKDVNSHYYPCKPNVFAATYDLVVEGAEVTKESLARAEERRLQAFTAEIARLRYQPKFSGAGEAEAELDKAISDMPLVKPIPETAVHETIYDLARMLTTRILGLAMNSQHAQNIVVEILKKSYDLGRDAGQKDQGLHLSARLTLLQNENEELKEKLHTIETNVEFVQMENVALTNDVKKLTEFSMHMKEIGAIYEYEPYDSETNTGPCGICYPDGTDPRHDPEI